MNPTILVASIGGLALVLVSIVQAYSAKTIARSGKVVEATKTKVDEVAVVAQKIEVSVDGKLSRMLQLLEESNYRRGIIDERNRVEVRSDLREDAANQQFHASDSPVTGIIIAPTTAPAKPQSENL